MPVVVREVRPADAAAWTALRQALWPHADCEELRATVDEFFGRGTPLVAAAFLACEMDTAVGFLELSVRAYVPGASTVPAPFVEGWFVTPDVRGAGVGRALILAAERWARNNGYQQLGSDTELENDLSAATHRALGFREVERVRFFIKDIAHRHREPNDT